MKRWASQVMFLRYAVRPIASHVGQVSWLGRNCERPSRYRLLAFFGGRQRAPKRGVGEEAIRRAAAMGPLNLNIKTNLTPSG